MRTLKELDDRHTDRTSAEISIRKTMIGITTCLVVQCTRIGFDDDDDGSGGGDGDRREGNTGGRTST